MTTKRMMVGLVSLRAPDGSFLEAQPIYREVAVTERGQTPQEEENDRELIRELALQFRCYKTGATRIQAQMERSGRSRENIERTTSPE